MNPPASFAFLITTAQSLAAAVNTRDSLHLRPQTARKAVAARLASGLRVLRAFVRRLIILMALELEWGLVDKRAEMKRPHKRKSKPTLNISLKALDAQGPSPWLNGDGPQFQPAIKNDHTQGHGSQGYGTPVDIDMTKLYAQLDFLSKIAANPAAKAQRMAFHLARTYEGIIMAPQGPARIAGRWGTQVSASFDAMAGAIITKSRKRPPPLMPLRTHWPTINAL
jgi:hypothetical protein